MRSHNLRRRPPTNGEGTALGVTGCLIRGAWAVRAASLADRPDACILPCKRRLQAGCQHPDAELILLTSEHDLRSVLPLYSDTWPAESLCPGSEVKCGTVCQAATQVT